MSSFCRPWSVWRRATPHRALEKLAEAVALAEPGGFIRPFLDQGPETADLLDRLVKQNPSLSFAGLILAAFGSRKPEPSNNRSGDPNRPPVITS